MNIDKVENGENTNGKQEKIKIVYDIAIVVLVAVVLFSVCMILWNRYKMELTVTGTTKTTSFQQPSVPTKPVATSRPTEPVIQLGEVDIRLKQQDDEVFLIAQIAQDYLTTANVPGIENFLEPYWTLGSRMDRGQPVTISYTVYSLPENVSVTNAVFRVCTANDSEVILEQEVDADSRYIQVYNLNACAEYIYQVLVNLSDGVQKCLNGSFRTAKAPRLMHIDGVVNVRDIGGWVTSNGKTIPQGLLYRGSELDGVVESKFCLTEKGLEELYRLGIRADLDLRSTGKDILGSNVEHIYYDFLQYELAFTPAGMSAVRRVFADLANPDYYPIYLHCTYGMDRTGTVCYLLLGLLGVEDADLMRDYELSALYYGFVSSQEMDGFVQKIGALPGATTQERVRHFLLSAGVTQAQMDSIYQIFLG